MDNFDIIKAKYEILQKDISKGKLQTKIYQDDIFVLQQAKQFLISFSEYSREQIKEKLETLANTALKAIFTDKTVTFKIISDRQKRGLFYELMVETDGMLTPLQDAKGGGILDIISIALRISFLKLFQAKLRSVLILDEPFKNLDASRIVLAIEWLKTVSKELEIQFVIVTHIENLIFNANKNFHIKIVNGISQIENC